MCGIWIGISIHPVIEKMKTTESLVASVLNFLICASASCALNHKMELTKPMPSQRSKARAPLTVSFNHSALHESNRADADDPLPLGPNQACRRTHKMDHRWTRGICMGVVN